MATAIKEAYLVRHQHGHVNEQVVFTTMPSQAQVDAVLEHDDKRYGQKCDPEWHTHPARIMRVELITDASTIPTFGKTSEPDGPEPDGE